MGICMGATKRFIVWFMSVFFFVWNKFWCVVSRHLHNSIIRAKVLKKNYATILRSCFFIFYEWKIFFFPTKGLCSMWKENCKNCCSVKYWISFMQYNMSKGCRFVTCTFHLSSSSCAICMSILRLSNSIDDPKDSVTGWSLLTGSEYLFLLNIKKLSKFLWT